jgi:hypothetical protein
LVRRADNILEDDKRRVQRTQGHGEIGGRFCGTKPAHPPTSVHPTI